MLEILILVCAYGIYQIYLESKRRRNEHNNANEKLAEFLENEKLRKEAENDSR